MRSIHMDPQNQMVLDTRPADPRKQAMPYGLIANRTWLRTLAVAAGYDEHTDATSEIVLAREKFLLRRGSRAEVGVTRVCASRRAHDDQVDIAFIVDGDVFARHSASLNGDDIVRWAVDTDFADEKTLWIAVKILRRASPGESMCLDRQTQEPRLQAWVDVMPPRAARPWNLAIPADGRAVRTEMAATASAVASVVPAAVASTAPLVPDDVTIFARDRHA